MTDAYQEQVAQVVRRALVGEVTPAMRAVAVECTDAEVLLRVVFDGPISDDACGEFDAGVVGLVAEDVAALGHGSPRVRFEFIRVDAPVPIPSRGTFVFARPDTRFVSCDSRACTRVSGPFVALA